MAGLTLGTGANVLVRTESRPAGLKTQQAQKPTIGAGDSRPPSPGCGHRPADFGKAGPGRHCAACESSQRRSGTIESLALGDVITFHDRLQVPGRADDERGMDMIVAEEVPYLTDGGGQRMSCGSREHHLGSGAQDLIHRSRIRTAVRAQMTMAPPSPDHLVLGNAQVGEGLAEAGRRLASAIYWPESAAAMSSRMRAGGKCCS